jgi:hypothetical protein
MDGVNSYLKFQMAHLRYQELLDEAARARRVDESLAKRVQARQNVLSEGRAAVASALFRTAAWLMPEDSREQAPHGGFELRPSR